MSRILPVLNKPNFGEPCNNCGLCCIEEACGISQQVFGDDRTPCAALEKHGEKFLCGLITSPRKYLPQKASAEQSKFFAQTVSDALGIGKGCCAEWIADFTASDEVEK